MPRALSALALRAVVLCTIITTTTASRVVLVDIAETTADRPEPLCTLVQYSLARHRRTRDTNTQNSRPPLKGGQRQSSESSRFDVEQLVRDVKSQYDAYPAETLSEMWDYKQHIMKVVARDGSNTYDRHRR